MRMYLSVFKLRLLNGLQYRTAALAGLATQFCWGFMFIMVYEAFYLNGTAGAAISLEQLVDYMWLQQAFLVFIALWLRDSELFSLITSGNIAYELCRPCGIYEFWYAKLLAQRFSGAMLRCFPVLIIAALLPDPYGLSGPSGIAAAVLFAVTLMLGLLMVVSISMLIYISVFITMSPVGSFLMIGVLGEFFAGMIIPIPLMPHWLQRIAYFLPFRLAVDLPFRVYSGNIPVMEGIRSIIIQAIWLVFLVLLGRVLMKKAIKKVVVQGG